MKKEFQEFCARHRQLRALELKDIRLARVAEKYLNAIEDDKVEGLEAFADYHGLTTDNYSEVLRTYLYTAEAYDQIGMHNFDMLGKNLQRNIKFRQGASAIVLEIPDLIGSELKLNWYDNVIFMLDDSTPIIYVITGVKDNSVDLTRASQTILRPDDMKRITDVHFVANGAPYIACHKALKHFEDRQCFFERVILRSSSPSCYERAPKIDVEDTDEQELVSRMEQLNEQQRCAVVGILEAKCRPNPYIIYGPPGTGKSRTIIEAVVQVYNRSRRSKILVAVNSNLFADYLHDELKETGCIRSLHRLRAEESVQVVENFNKLWRSRVIVTTNIKSSSMIFKFNFDYVFLDEAGHACEAESLVPLCMLKHNGCFVLAGDPKQLGPVVKLAQLKKLGFETTMLDRLLQLDVYQRDDDNQYDPQYLTKLLRSYRCDRYILQPSNKLFYKGELLLDSQTPAALLGLLKRERPIIFEPIRGKEMKSDEGHSLYNKIEADRCIQIIMNLYELGIGPDMIGVISPYKMQSEYIHSALFNKIKTRVNRLDRIRPIRFLKNGLVQRVVANKVYDIDAIEKAKEKEKEKSNFVERCERWMCKVDSVDAFQGDEREIILISTVRTTSSERHQCSFIEDPRRFNVSMSRAKWIVIVVGDFALLNCLKYWNELAHWCDKSDHLSLIESAYCK